MWAVMGIDIGCAACGQVVVWLWFMGESLACAGSQGKTEAGGGSSSSSAVAYKPIR
jgi:hypothetical protein